MVTATLPQGRSRISGPRKKSKRTRTGCLTCRERHLKCDEASPDCINCRKSNKVCRRGLRVNFLDIHVVELQDIPFADQWTVGFQDESRNIASEYLGGLKRYEAVDTSASASTCSTFNNTTTGNSFASRARKLYDRERFSRILPSNVNGPVVRRFRSTKTKASTSRSASELPRTNIISSTRLSFSPSPHRHASHMPPTPPPRIKLPNAPRVPVTPTKVKQETTSPTLTTNDWFSAASILPQATQASSSKKDRGLPNAPLSEEEGLSPLPGSPQTDEREYLGSPEEVRCMQIFVEQVGVWMDSFDTLKHFSQITPYHALKSPMLLHACLSCAMKHESLTLPESGDKALSYYNTATTALLLSLQNPDRNMAECATAAVILNVYEIMSDTQTQRMNHIAGARALIRECGWNATSTGVGATCFWLNIEMELMNCLAMSWYMTWDPDDWGVDMRMGNEEDVSSIGKEETWVHKIFYIMAKVANFRAAGFAYPELRPQNEHFKYNARRRQWEELWDSCNRWNSACPRTMHPIGYLEQTGDVSPSSLFPKIWLIKRAAVISRLFYHTARYILAETAPEETPRSIGGWHDSQVHHARQVCGIVAHSTDRGIASTAARCLAKVARVLIDAKERDEILQMLDQISSQSGLQMGSIKKGLGRTWGSNMGNRSSQASQNHANPCPQHFIGSRQSSVAPENAGLTTHLPRFQELDAVNPLRCADFKLPNRPYKNWYEPPNKTNVVSPPLF